MAARLIDGTVVASRIRAETTDLVARLLKQGIEVRLEAVMVGDPASASIYTQRQAQRCAEVGIEYHLNILPADSTEREIQDHIQRLNDDPKVTGIILNLPLPEHIDTAAMQLSIDPYKDVEGVNPSNVGLLFYDCPIIAPCTALAVMEMLSEAGCEVRGMDAVVVGQGEVAGRPITAFLTHRLATVSACHIATRDLMDYTRRAELLVVATGVPHLIGRDHVREGAIVIDVGINRVPDPKNKGKTMVVGDVRFDEVSEVAGAMTPVPGGVGPVTVSMLLRSTAEAAQRQAEPRRLI
jgi:methylenetetrahydrofolate dehydrogenase (NADP+)/methenyltetrahydrofolate cyclohydrolase